MTNDLPDSANLYRSIFWNVRVQSRYRTSGASHSTDFLPETRAGLLI